MAGTQQARLTEQMPFVGTVEEKRQIETLARREGVSKATVVRWAVDSFFGITDGEERPAPPQV